MSQVTASKAAEGGTNPAARRAQDAPAALELSYGQIGISAVAAAARYQGDASNQSYAPAVGGKKGTNGN